MNLPAPVCILTLAAVLLNGFLYAFSSALRNAPEGELRRRAEEGDRKAEKLERLVDEPKIYILVYLITFHIIVQGENIRIQGPCCQRQPDRKARPYDRDKNTQHR